MSLFCQNGDLCRNKNKDFRPTRLRPQSEAAGICSYCRAAVIEIPEGLSFSKITLSDAYKPALEPITSRGDTDHGQSAQEEDNSLQSEASLLLQHLLAEQQPQFESDRSFLIEKEGLQRGDHILSSKVDQVLSAKLNIEGFDVTGNVTSFLDSRSVSMVTRQRLLDYLTSLGDQDVVEICLSSTILEGSSRSEALWRNGFQNLISTERWVIIARQANTHGTLILSNEPRTLIAKAITRQEAASANAEESSGVLMGMAKKLAIYANPFFLAILDDDSLAKAIAHEELHHSDNHYKIMAELLTGWLNANKSASLDEKSRARSLAERAIDCAANEKLGISELSLRLPPDDAGYDRRLLSIAAVRGHDVKENLSTGAFFLPLQTISRTNILYGTSIEPQDSVRKIFQTLLNADR